MDVLQPQTTGVLVAGVLSLSLLYWLSTRRPAGLPPGPGPALPLLGHLLLLERDPRAQFRQWRRQYGDVFSYYVGSRLVVVLNGLDVLKEAFVKMAQAFSDRPHMFYGDNLNEGKGNKRCNGITSITTISAAQLSIINRKLTDACQTSDVRRGAVRFHISVSACAASCL